MRALLIAAIVIGLARASAAQEIALASRAPRFLFVASSRAAPVEVDARSNLTLRRVVSLNIDQPTVGRLLASIERQTGLRFAYSRDVLDSDRPVKLRADTITVGAALLSILMDAGVDVLLSAGSQVSLVARSKVAADTGAVAGRVIDKKTGAAVAGATVLVEGTRSSATTGNDGRYRIGGLAAGAYTVRARYIGYAPASGSVTVSGGQEAAADFALEKSAQRLDEVVTTGTVVPTEVKALPTPVSVIRESDISQQRPHTVQELLRQLVPTAVSWDYPDRPNQTSFSVRGASTLSGLVDQMKVFVDGVPAASQNFASVDPASIERIEVIRGPQAAAIYGSDAIGGVIQIFTKRGGPDVSRPHADAQAALGIAQTPYAGFGGVARQTYAASVRGQRAEVGYNFGGGYSYTPDYLPGGEISHQSSPSFYGGVHLSHGMITADVGGRYYVQNVSFVINPALAQTGFVFYSKPFYEPDQNQNQTIGAQLTMTPTRWWQQTVTVGLDRLGFDETQVQPRLTTPADTLLSVNVGNTKKASIGYNTTVHGQIGPGLSGSLTAGFDHYSLVSSSLFTSGALVTTGTIVTAPGETLSGDRDITNNTGYFAQAQLGVRDALFLTGGVRAEQNTNFGPTAGTPVSPRLGVSFVQPTGPLTLKLRGSWGRAIRAPAAGDKSASVDPFEIILANPDLGPERQHGWDAGADALFGNRASLGVTYYDQIAENLIQFVQLAPGAPPTFQFQNVGRVKNTGVEIEASVSLGELQLRGQYGYARARVEQLAPHYSGTLLVEDQTLNTPKHTAGVSASFVPLPGTSIASGLTYVGSWHNTDVLAEARCFGGTGPCRPTLRDYVIAYPGFAKLNLTLSQQITPLVSGFVSVDNLTNNETPEVSNGAVVLGRITTVGLHFAY